MTSTELTRKDILKATDINEGNFLQRRMPTIARLIGKEKDPLQNVKAVREGLEKLGIVAPAKGSVGEAYTKARQALQVEFDKALQRLETAVEGPLDQTIVTSLESFMGLSPKEQQAALKLLGEDDRTAIVEAGVAWQREIRVIAGSITELVACTKKVAELPEGSTRDGLVTEIEGAKDTAAIKALSKKVAITLKSQASVEAAKKLTKSIAKTADLIDPKTKLVSTGAGDGNLVVLDDTTARELQAFMKSRMEVPKKALENARSEFAREQSEENLKALQEATTKADEAFEAVQAVFTVVADGLKDYGELKSNAVDPSTSERLVIASRFDNVWNTLRGHGAKEPELLGYQKARVRLKDSYYEAVTKAVEDLGENMTAEELEKALEPFEERRKQLFRAEGLKSEEEVNKKLGKYQQFLVSGLNDFRMALQEKLKEVVTARTTSPKKESEEDFIFT